MNRLLLVAPDDGASASWIRAAFERAGWTVDSFDYRKRVRVDGPLSMGLALRDRSKSSDLVLVLKGEAIEPKVFKALAAGGKRVALWHFDPRDGLEPWLIERAQECGWLFTIGRGLIPEYDKLGINAHWLSEAADPQVHRPKPVHPSDATFPVGFIGTVDGVPGRSEWLAEVLRECGDGFHLFGSFPGDFGVMRCYHGRAEQVANLPGDEALAWVVSHTGVSLGRDRNPEIAGSYGARLFRTLASGGFFLTAYTKGMEDDFGGLGGFAWINEGDDWPNAIRYWLDRPEERRQIADRGRVEVLARHTWGHRVKELLRVTGL